MELRAQIEYGLVCGLSLVLLGLGFDSKAAVDEQMNEAKETLSDVERSYREGLAELFSINKNVRDMAQRRHELNLKMMEHEARVRWTAQDLDDLQSRTDLRRERLGKRLRSIYQSRYRKGIEWLFSARSPVELERNQRFLKKLAIDDYRALKRLLVDLRHVREKRKELEKLVARLIRMQKNVKSQEQDLARQLTHRSQRLAELKKIKSTQLTKIKSLRALEPQLEANYSFYEKQGGLNPPVVGRLVRQYGAYVDPQNRFRLLHKGHFYAVDRGQEIHAVFDGKVAVAGKVPGYSSLVLLDHGDNYYSVYAYASKIRVREGQTVKAGEIMGTTGIGSPLFGPGLHFEIRHFADAIDPSPWIKESVVKAQASTSPGGEI